jgi:hypothetical protein
MTEPRELPDQLKHLSLAECWNALLLRWDTLGVSPTRASVILKLAHIHLETGGLTYCHCYNLGNLKHVRGSGRCWCMFECGEEIPRVSLAACERACPGHVTIRAEYTRAGAPWVSLRLTPPHPWTWFDAFETLEQGIDAQLAYLKRANHADVLEALMTGDARHYSQALHHDGYFTASPKAYADGLVARVKVVERDLADVDWGDVT